jgi:hypothetical protein
MAVPSRPRTATSGASATGPKGKIQPYAERGQLHGEVSFAPAGEESDKGASTQNSFPSGSAITTSVTGLTDVDPTVRARQAVDLHVLIEAEIEMRQFFTVLVSGTFTNRMSGARRPRRCLPAVRWPSSWL